MPLLNYTTQISVHKTLGEIQQILVDHGARKLMFNYDDKGKIISLTFSVVTPNGEKVIMLPSNVVALF